MNHVNYVRPFTAEIGDAVIFVLLDLDSARQLAEVAVGDDKGEVRINGCDTRLRALLGT